MYNFTDFLRHFFDRKWVVASAGFPNPEPTTFPGALLGAIVEGGEVVYLR